MTDDTLTDLLARRVAANRGLVETEWSTSSAVAEHTDEPIGRMFPELRRLERDGLVTFDDRRYRVPPERIDRASEFLENSRDRDERSVSRGHA